MDQTLDIIKCKECNETGSFTVTWDSKEKLTSSKNIEENIWLMCGCCCNKIQVLVINESP